MDREKFVKKFHSDAEGLEHLRRSFTLRPGDLVWIPGPDNRDWVRVVVHSVDKEAFVNVVYFRGGNMLGAAVGCGMVRFGEDKPAAPVADGQDNEKGEDHE